MTEVCAMEVEQGATGFPSGNTCFIPLLGEDVRILPLLEGHFKSFEATSKKVFKSTSIFFQKLVDLGHKITFFTNLTIIASFPSLGCGSDDMPLGCSSAFHLTPFTMSVLARFIEFFCKACSKHA